MTFETLKYFLKQWRIWVVIACVAASLILIAPSTGQKGVIVNSISSDSPFSGKIQAGEIITWANEKDINSPEDLYEFANFTGTFRIIHSGKLDLVYFSGQNLGLSVSKIPTSNLQFGIDLVGGTRVLLKPKTSVSDAVLQQITSTLETRINVFGLKEAKFQPIKDVTGTSYIQIEMAGASKEEVENLLSKEGKFEGKIPRIVTFSNNTGKLTLEKNYIINLKNDSIEINNTLLKINESSILEGVPFQLINVTDNSAVLFFTVFSGKDIQSVCLQDQPGICVSRILMVTGGYEFNFQVFITTEGAENFAKVTKDLKVITDPNSGSKYLESKIFLYLDENLITELSISADLKGQAYTTPAITGFRKTRDEALKEQLMLKSILQSGALPISLEITRMDQVSPNLGREFIEATLIAAIVASITVATVLYIRYRSLKILLPNMIWSISELILTLGGAALIKWTLDLSSIAGLIAAIGTGTNDQIIIIDEMLGGEGEEEEKIYSKKQKIKKAFFYVFSAAATIVASVVPMIFVGMGAMKGFAVTTLLGIFIGIVITRPAFAIVAQRVLEDRIKDREEKELSEKGVKAEKVVEKSIEKKIESDSKKEEVSKEEIIKKEWKKLMDMTAEELFNKPFNELTNEQREEVKKIMSKAEEKEEK
jgi:protein-export membrane protein SecD